MATAKEKIIAQANSIKENTAKLKAAKKAEPPKVAPEIPKDVPGTPKVEAPPKAADHLRAQLFDKQDKMAAEKTPDYLRDQAFLNNQPT